MAKVHELKTWPEYFESVRSGVKRFELRVDDRPFDVGDTLHLREYEPGSIHPKPEGTARGYTGRELKVPVLYALRDPSGSMLPPDIVAMSIGPPW